jgi:hypothetical protein
VVLCFFEYTSQNGMKEQRTKTEVKVKVKLSRYRPGQALGVPGG